MDDGVEPVNLELIDLSMAGFQALDLPNILIRKEYVDALSYIETMEHSWLESLDPKLQKRRLTVPSYVICGNPGIGNVI
jgi:hypothetical protein